MTMSASIIPTATATQPSTFGIPSASSIYDDSFHDILGPAPKLELLLENNAFPFAHEAGVYIPSTESLFMTSNIFIDPITHQKTIKITRVSVSENPVTSEIINSTVPMPNGGVNNATGFSGPARVRSTQPAACSKCQSSRLTSQGW